MTQVSFRIDDHLKADGERLFKSMGMNMSVAITVFIQQSLQRGKLPFEILGDPFYSKPNKRARNMASWLLSNWLSVPCIGKPPPPSAFAIHPVAYSFFSLMFITSSFSANFSRFVPFTSSGVRSYD